MLFLHSHGVTTSRAVGYSRPTGSRQSRRCERTRICWRRTPTGSASRPPTRSLRRSGFPKIRLTGRGLELTTCCWRRPRTVTVLFRWRKLELAATKLLETAEATVEQALSQMLTSGSAVIRGNRRRAADLPALLEKGGRCADVQIIAVFQVVHVTQTANHESALPTLGAFHTGRSNQPKGRKRVHSSTQISMPQCSRPHFYVLFADRPCLSFLTFNETRSSHNPKVGGSNPPPATNCTVWFQWVEPTSTTGSMTPIPNSQPIFPKFFTHRFTHEHLEQRFLPGFSQCARHQLPMLHKPSSSKGSAGPLSIRHSLLSLSLQVKTAKIQLFYVRISGLWHVLSTHEASSQVE